MSNISLCGYTTLNIHLGEKATTAKGVVWFLCHLKLSTYSTIGILQRYKYVFTQSMRYFTNMLLKSSLNFYIFEQVFYCQLLFTIKIKKPQSCYYILRFVLSNVSIWQEEENKKKNATHSFS